MQKQAENRHAYLRVIQTLDTTGDGIEPRDIAPLLRISEATAQRMAEDAVRQELATWTSDEAITLTAAGKEEAAAPIESEGKIKPFLVDVLGIDESEAEGDAFVLEYILGLDDYEIFGELLG